MTHFKFESGSTTGPLWFTLWRSRPLIFQMLLFFEVWNSEFNISKSNPPHEFNYILIWLCSAATKIYSSNSRDIVSLVKELQLLLRPKLFVLDPAVLFHAAQSIPQPIFTHGSRVFNHCLLWFLLSSLILVHHPS